MKLPIKPAKDIRGKTIPWTSCKPFVENTRAALIHRPRHVATYKISDRWKSHIGINNWCGNTTTGTTKFTFLDAPPEGKILCAKCEEAAVKNGLPSANELAGRHVHVGGVAAVIHCCQEPV